MFKRNILIVSLFLIASFLISGCGDDYYIGSTLEQQANKSILKISKIKITDKTQELTESPSNMKKTFSDKTEAQICAVLDKEAKEKLNFKFDDGIIFVLKDGSFSSLDKEIVEKNNTDGLFIDIPELSQKDDFELSIPFKKIDKPEEIKGIILISRPSSFHWTMSHSEKNDRKATYIPLKIVKLNESKFPSWNLIPINDSIFTAFYDAQADSSNIVSLVSFSDQPERDKKALYKNILNE